jgi:hypothetical protein
MVEPLTAGKPPRPYSGGMMHNIPSETAEERAARHHDEDLMDVTEEQTHDFMNLVGTTGTPVPMDAADIGIVPHRRDRNYLTGRFNQTLEEAEYLLQLITNEAPVNLVRQRLSELQQFASTQGPRADTNFRVFTHPGRTIYDAVTYPQIVAMATAYVENNNAQEVKDFRQDMDDNEGLPFSDILDRVVNYIDAQEEQDLDVDFNVIRNDMEELERILRPFYRVFGQMVPRYGIFDQYELPFTPYHAFIGNYADTIRILQNYGSDELKQRVANVRVM